MRNRESIRERLVTHLANEGTLNDSETGYLFKEAYGLGDEDEVALEVIERWAVDLLS